MLGGREGRVLEVKSLHGELLLPYTYTIRSNPSINKVTEERPIEYLQLRLNDDRTIKVRVPWRVTVQSSSRSLDAQFWKHSKAPVTYPRKWIPTGKFVFDSSSAISIEPRSNWMASHFFILKSQLLHRFKKSFGLEQ